MSETQEQPKAEQFPSLYFQCAECKGTGKETTFNDPCFECGGSGRFLTTFGDELLELMKRAVREVLRKGVR